MCLLTSTLSVAMSLCILIITSRLLKYASITLPEALDVAFGRDASVLVQHACYIHHENEH